MKRHNSHHLGAGQNNATASGAPKSKGSSTSSNATGESGVRPSARDVSALDTGVADASAPGESFTPELPFKSQTRVRPRNTRPPSLAPGMPGLAAVSGLGAALTLADERCSVVVLETGSTWASALPSALAGQQAVFVLNQLPGESITQLQRRVALRLRSSEFPPQRLLWSAAPHHSTHAVRLLQELITRLDDAELQVLLIAGSDVWAVSADASSSSILPPVPARSETNWLPPEPEPASFEGSKSA